MLRLPEKEVSLLKPDGFKPKYPELGSDIEVDTVIVGGGIAGISAAYLLKKSGQKVAVIEKDCIGSGTTGHTTGKVTSQHSLIYNELVNQFGRQTAKLYGQANQAAVEEIAKLIKAEGIDCGWQQADNYVYTADPARLKEFKNEARIAAGLGLPATFEKSLDLPFKISGAVKFAGQAHFSGQKYIEGLAAKVNGGGSYVFEKTKATSIKDGSPCRVGSIDHTVTAKNIIVATNVPTFPLAARGAYCILEYPTSSYLVAGKPKIKVKGMYISPDDDHYSILPVGGTLLIGGENHIPGTRRAKSRQQKLADYAEEYFGVKKIDYRWHARDYLAYDQIPLIGKMYPWSRHLYVITAFKKWGLSHSMVSAMILRDLILGNPNPWADIYNPMRTSPIKSIPRVAAKYISGNA
jgi:glycine/D-amino acid oxidase-like deaminating enzyme